MIKNVSEIKKIPKNITIISLFAGRGGSSTGYKSAGGDVLLANEINPKAAKTYKANWDETEIITEDIRELNPLEILQKLKLNIGELDLLDGSPPCTAFSNAGKREKGWGKEKKHSGVVQKNIEDLSYEYIRFVDKIKPKVFVMENVASLTSGAAKGYFNDIMKNLKNCGYYVEAKIINAAFLGVPQMRRRLFIVGVRNDLMNDNFKNNLHPKPNQTITLKEAIQDIIHTEEELAEADIKKYKIYSLLTGLMPGQSHKERFTLQKAHPDKPCNTLTASMKSIGAANVCHWDNRAFTIKELKRIMSFPDDYVFLGGREDAAEGIGNAVCPLVSRAILENLIKIGVFKIT